MGLFDSGSYAVLCVLITAPAIRTAAPCLMGPRLPRKSRRHLSRLRPLDRRHKGKARSLPCTGQHTHHPIDSAPGPVSTGRFQNLTAWLVKSGDPSSERLLTQPTHHDQTQPNQVIPFLNKRRCPFRRSCSTSSSCSTKSQLIFSIGFPASSGFGGNLSRSHQCQNGDICISNVRQESLRLGF
jgi:hypothetical protein